MGVVQLLMTVFQRLLCCRVRVELCTASGRCSAVDGCIPELVALQGQGGFVSPMGFRTMKEEMMSADCSVGAGPAAQKTESKKHPSLPKEVSCFFLFIRVLKSSFFFLFIHVL